MDTLASLPVEVLVTILEHVVPLHVLPASLGGLLRVSKAVGATTDRDELWLALALRPGIQRDEATAPRGAARRSGRLATLTGRERFHRAWAGMLARSEAFHHQLACWGQDSKDLTSARLLRSYEQWAPLPLLDRASPVYNATPLMEVCRAKCAEGNLLAAAERLVLVYRADPNATNAENLSPLIIASARALPRLAALLLALGADPRPCGTGRFRVCGCAQSVHGRHSALEWTRVLLEREREAEVSAAHMAPLHFTRRLLERFDTPQSRAENPRQRAASMLSEARGDSRQQRKETSISQNIETGQALGE